MTDRESRQLKKKMKLDGIIAEAEILLGQVKPFECLKLSLALNMGGVSSGKAVIGFAPADMFDCPMLVSPDAHGLGTLVNIELDRAKSLSSSFCGKINICLAMESVHVFSYRTEFEFDIFLQSFTYTK